MVLGVVDMGVGFGRASAEVLKDADALLIVTEWPVFRTPDFDRMGKFMKNKVIFDGRNLYELDTMSKYGFSYISIGRKEIYG